MSDRIPLRPTQVPHLRNFLGPKTTKALARHVTHEASGWMLREAGKKDLTGLRAFLTEHVHHMPRTMLRYTIEKMSAAERAKWMRF